MSEETRKDAIEKAVEENVPEETTEEETTETEEAEPKEDNEDTDSEETRSVDAETDNALKLYRALNDPNVGPDIVRIMAQKAGLLNPNLTQEQQKAATKTIKDVVAEELGPDFSQFTERFSKILERILPAVVEARVQQVEQSVRANQR